MRSRKVIWPWGKGAPPGPAGAVASVHINRIIGMKAARRTGFTAMPVSGTEAHALGLVALLSVLARVRMEVPR